LRQDETVYALQRQTRNHQQLESLARFARAGCSDDVYVAVSALFEQQHAELSARERSLAADILRHLAKDVEMSIRIGVAERIADHPDAPSELVLLLADDCIEVARPVLARSPVLRDEDLLKLVRHGSAEHQVAIAGRPNLGIEVTAALARSQCEAAIVALLRNPTAHISAYSFEYLLEQARTTPGLQAPLAARADLPAQLASRLYGWVSAALKTALAQRYPELAKPIADAIDDSVAALTTGTSETSDDSAARLVAKLHASHQLGPSFLVRVLRQGQPDLFEHGCALLLGVDVNLVRRAVRSGRPGMLALICRGVGIDKAAFPTICALRSKSPVGSVQISQAQRQEIDSAFAEPSRASAALRFRASALL
jgi:uncharacterized protein (DUF2336 family)